MVSSCALEISLARETHHLLFVQIFDRSTIAETLLLKNLVHAQVQWLELICAVRGHKDYINIAFFQELQHIIS